MIDANSAAWAIFVVLALEGTGTLAVFAGLAVGTGDAFTGIVVTVIEQTEAAILTRGRLALVLDAVSVAALFTSIAGLASAGVAGTATVDTTLTVFAEDTSAGRDAVALLAILAVFALLVLTRIAETLAIITDQASIAGAVLVTAVDNALALHTDLRIRTIFVELAARWWEALAKAANLLGTGAFDTFTGVVGAAIGELVTDSTVLANVGCTGAIVGLTIAIDTNFTSVAGDSLARIVDALAIDALFGVFAVDACTSSGANAIFGTTEFILPTLFRVGASTDIVFAVAIGAEDVGFVFALRVLGVAT